MSLAVSPGHLQGRCWHGQQVAALGRLGDGGAGSGTAGASWQAHRGVLSPCLLWGGSQEPLCPFVPRFSVPASESHSQTNPFTCPRLNSRCYQLCLCKCLKHKQWVSTIYSRHFTEKKQRIGYVRQSSSFNAQLNERLQKALSTRVCKGAIKAENIVLL